MKLRIIQIFLLLFCLAALSCPLAAQTLHERLTQQGDFIPKSASPPDQLIEVARKYQIPMAIEWLEEKEEVQLPPLSYRGGSVELLIEAIVHRSASHQLLIDDQMVHVSSNEDYAHPFNFLNLKIGVFGVKDEFLLGAEYALRHSINVLLYPELYKNGWGGGYGGGSPSEFWEKNITFSGSNLTIREVLDSIIGAQGKFLWIVKLKREELQGDNPKWIGVPIDKHGQSPLNTRWRFILLGEERSNKAINPTRFQDALYIRRSLRAGYGRR